MFSDIDTAIGEARAVHANNRGYFTIFSKEEGKKKSHISYPMSQLDEVVTAVKSAPDTYISQSSFIYPGRKSSALKDLGCAFVDIDCYKLGITPNADFVDSLLDKACCFGIPHPSYIISSGRGLYLKWIFNSAVPAKKLLSWNALQNALITIYYAIGADTAARDASRVLRVVGSTNSASDGAGVAPVWNSGQTHDFSALCNEVSLVDLPGIEVKAAVKLKQAQARIKKIQEGCLTSVDMARQQKASVEHLKLFSGQRQTIMLNDMSLLQLNWQRFIDLRDLSIMRGGINQGSRDLTLFWMGAFLGQSGIITPDNFEAEMSELASGFPGEDFQPMQDGSMSSLLSRLKAHQRGEKVIFDGHSYSSMYTPTNSKLIDIFEITAEEQAELSTIIDAREKQVRSDAKVPGRLERREKRAEWRFKAADLAKQAKADGKEVSVTEIAIQVGVHKTQVSRLLSGKIGQPRKPRARAHIVHGAQPVNYATIYGVRAATGRGGAPIKTAQLSGWGAGEWAFCSRPTTFPTNPFKRIPGPGQVQEQHDPAFDLRTLTPESALELFQKNLKYPIPSDSLITPSVAGFALSRGGESGKGALKEEVENEGFQAGRRFRNCELTPQPATPAAPTPAFGCHQSPSTPLRLNTVKSSTVWPTRIARPQPAPPVTVLPIAAAPAPKPSALAYLNTLDPESLRTEVLRIQAKTREAFIARQAEDDAITAARAEINRHHRQAEEEQRQRKFDERVEKIQSRLSKNKHQQCRPTNT